VLNQLNIKNPKIYVLFYKHLINLIGKIWLEEQMYSLGYDKSASLRSINEKEKDRGQRSSSGNIDLSVE
jgi:hypothetical protein